MNLAKTKAGFHGPIKSISGHKDVTERLTELGFIPGRQIRFISKSFFGEPFLIEVGATKVALRKSEAECIEL